MDLDRKDLKIEALKQKIAKIVTQYEDQESDYRVEITLLSNDLEFYKTQHQAVAARVEELEAQLTEFTDDEAKEDPESAD